MPYSTLGKNAMLNALGALAVYASLHSADPGDNGANEISGGSPAYARKAIAWEAAGSGTMNKNATPAVVFDVGAGKTVLYVGFWSALTSGTFYGAALVTQEDFGGQGTYTLTDADLDLNA
jgi:hypothetical protein